MQIKYLLLHPSVVTFPFCNHFITVVHAFFFYSQSPAIGGKSASEILTYAYCALPLCPPPPLSVSLLSFRYCLSGLPVDCQMKNITNPDQTSLLLEDLIIWTNYEIEVAAYNGAGRGTYSHKVTEWTLQGGEGNKQMLLKQQV